MHMLWIQSVGNRQINSYALSRAIPNNQMSNRQAKREPGQEIDLVDRMEDWSSMLPESYTAEDILPSNSQKRKRTSGKYDKKGEQWFPTPEIKQSKEKYASITQPYAQGFLKTITNQSEAISSNMNSQAKQFCSILECFRHAVNVELTIRGYEDSRLVGVNTSKQ